MREELQSIGCDEAKHVETNMGNMPLEDYYDIVAMQHGYDSYDNMKKDGLIIAPPETIEDKGILWKENEIKICNGVYLGGYSIMDWEPDVNEPTNKKEKNADCKRNW